MHKMIRAYLPLFAILIATPLQAQEQQVTYKAADLLALKNLQSLDRRLHMIGYRLIQANSPYCQAVTARAGLLLHDIRQYPDQVAARFALDFSGPIAINAIAPDSPADRAGLKAGDGIVAINGALLGALLLNDPALAGEAENYRRIAAVNRTLAEALARGKTVLDILRGGQRLSIAVEPQQTCPSRFQIRVSDDRNASANGTMVSITSRLADYFENDDEFAAVVAHELAHNLLKHRERLNAQKVNRGFFGQFGKSAGRIKAAEIEADRLSVWLMANAGYDPQAAIRFWTRYGKEHGKGIFSASTHYRWKKRVRLFEEEIVKMAAQEPNNGQYAPPLLATGAAHAGPDH